LNTAWTLTFHEERAGWSSSAFCTIDSIIKLFELHFHLPQTVLFSYFRFENYRPRNHNNNLQSFCIILPNPANATHSTLHSELSVFCALWTAHARLPVPSVVSQEKHEWCDFLPSCKIHHTQNILLTSEYVQYCMNSESGTSNFHYSNNAAGTWANEKRGKKRKWQKINKEFIKVRQK
jgi:hypothetical protein